MRDWELLYERAPLKQDVLLFVVAVALHTPLLFLRMNSVPKPTPGEIRLVKVELLENLNAKIAANPLGVQRTTGKAGTASIDAVRLKELRRRIETARGQSSLPVVKPRGAPPLSGLKSTGAAGVIPAPATQPLENKGTFATPTVASKNPLSLKGAGNSVAPVLARTGAAVGIVAPPVLQGKGSFSVGRQQISSIGDAGLRVGAGAGTQAPIALRTTATPGADPTVGTPIPLQNRGSFISGGGTGATATPRLSGGAQVVTPIPKKAGESLPPLTPPTATRLPPAFQITGALKERKVIYQETPIYPPSLRARGVESSVKLKFNVSAEGNVKEVTVLLSSGYRDMDMAAVSALRKWSFAPLDRYEDQEGIILMTFSLR